MARLIFIRCCLVAVIALFVISACSGSQNRPFSATGPDGGTKATIRSGPHTWVEGVDGQRVKASSLSVVVTPGSHILSVGFVSRTVGFKLLYAAGNASLPLVVQAGHRYTVYTEEVPESEWANLIVWSYNWVAYVRDDSSGERIAQSEPLPLREEHIPFPSFQRELPF